MIKSCMPSVQTKQTADWKASILGVWWYGPSHGTDHQLCCVPITMTALLREGEVVGRGLTVHQVHCLLGTRACQWEDE